MKTHLVHSVHSPGHGGPRWTNPVLKANLDRFTCTTAGERRRHREGPVNTAGEGDGGDELGLGSAHIQDHIQDRRWEALCR